MTTYPAAVAVRRILARGPRTGAALRRAVKYQYRDGLAAALAELVDSGQVLAEPIRCGGVRYALAEPVHPSVQAAETRRRNGSLPCQRCGVRKRRATGTRCGHCLAREAAQQGTAR
ncbi:hypothetical protein MN2019_17905 [Mycolicibacterium neoaurum]|uniref:hypothetical protein n=1 Tax=Mycolicibacterium neoaurum TaxID=1795 RepID=UPI001BCE9614|nr:hypothetical protein [Mycolicibacterium neoaurum]QVI26177.1 hypothetical protein MN2019_17905 [Mycolicibacterium neoaurum]